MGGGRLEVIATLPQEILGDSSRVVAVACASGKSGQEHFCPLVSHCLSSFPSRVQFLVMRFLYKL